MVYCYYHIKMLGVERGFTKRGIQDEVADEKTLLSEHRVRWDLV